MYYTIAFYIILAIICTRSESKEKILKWACITIAVYTSLRYNYPSDYPAYHDVFNMFANPSYQYDPDIDHFEYGWYLLNKVFAPVGYYVFVTFCDCLLAYGIYLVLDIYVPKKYMPLAILGIVAMGGFEVLLSSQRQLICAAIFLIAYRKLLYDKISKPKDLLKTTTLIYFAIIFLCHYFHTSSLFLIIVPFLFLLPQKSKLVLLGIAVTAIFLLFYASLYLPELFASASEQYGVYTYLNYSGEYSGQLSVFQIATYLFQSYFLAKVYLKYDCTKDEQCAILLAFLSILIVLSGYSLGQVARLSHYIYFFTFASICIVANKMSNENSMKYYIYINYIWVVWNLLKIFSVQRGSLYEYKLLIPYLFS